MYKLKLGKSKISYNSIKKMIDNLLDEKEVKKKPPKSEQEITDVIEKLRTEGKWQID